MATQQGHFPWLHSRDMLAPTATEYRWTSTQNGVSICSTESSSQAKNDVLPFVITLLLQWKFDKLAHMASSYALVLWSTANQWSLTA